MKSQRVLAFELPMNDRLQLQGWRPFDYVEQVNGQWRYTRKETTP